MLSDKSFTLVEVLTALAILAFSCAGLLLLSINIVILNDTNRNTTIAYNAIQTKMEEIKNAGFSCVFTSYPSPCTAPASTCPCGCTSCFCNGNTFDLEGISQGKGRIEISEEAPNLKKVRIVASFRIQSRNRIIGEDIDLDGILDSGEDANTNDQLDSPVELITLMVK